MPFDGTNAAPSLTLLSEILRGGPEHPMWPEGFMWRYSECKTCAIGLACNIWTELPAAQGIPAVGWASQEVAAAFSMEQGLARQIFFRLHEHLGFASYRQITPTHVADAIDQYLATRSDAPLYFGETGA